MEQKIIELIQTKLSHRPFTVGEVMNTFRGNRSYPAVYNNTRMILNHLVLNKMLVKLKAGKNHNSVMYRIV